MCSIGTIVDSWKYCFDTGTVAHRLEIEDVDVWLLLYATMTTCRSQTTVGENTIVSTHHWKIDPRDLPPDMKSFSKERSIYRLMHGRGGSQYSHNLHFLGP
mmetsp:Transcript_5046/g.32109  ORF Transcript_5046/g.32109 Transcript_5046/m.32109 type:complete len:101 (+) Transcript_5046:3640-3942(+)